MQRADFAALLLNEAEEGTQQGNRRHHVRISRLNLTLQER